MASILSAPMNNKWVEFPAYSAIFCKQDAVGTTDHILARLSTEYSQRAFHKNGLNHSSIKFYPQITPSISTPICLHKLDKLALWYNDPSDQERQTDAES